MKPSKMKFFLLSVLASFGLLLWGVKWFIEARNTSSASSCINGLRQIDAAIQQWALDNHKTTNDMPTWADLNGYMISMPVCPDGGKYWIGRVADRPRCSLGGTYHSLPPDDSVDLVSTNRPSERTE